MVRGVPGLALLVPLVHGEVGDPDELEVGGGAGLGEAAVFVGELCAKFEAERADALVDPLRIVVPHGGRAELGGDDGDEVGGSERGNAETGSKCGGDGVGQRREGWVGAQAGDIEEVEAAVTEAGADFAEQCLARRATEVAGIGNDEAEDGEVLLDLERGAELGREDVAERDHGGQAHVWLVDAVVADGLVVGHADEGRGERDAGGGECGGEEALGDAEDGVHLREGHLEVDLGELGLAVGAQVLVAEAAGNLEVAVEAGDHEDLLEDLRRLGERIEVAGMDAAGNEIIARALGRGARHEGRFDLEEALADEVVADGHGDAAAQGKVRLHFGPAQIEVAVLQAHLFVGDGVFGGREGRRPGIVEQKEFAGDDFDLAGGHVGVFEAGGAAADFPLTATTNSGRAASALAWAAAIFSSTTIWAMPERSRRSRKMRPPWSRRRLTQPIRTTSCPASSARSSPHIPVRCKVPRKSNVTMFLLYEVWRARPPDSSIQCWSG